jgi:GNAT superfamily N-acetyltransferase
VLIATPDNPGYYFGNYLIFKQPPKAGDHDRWRDLFRESFACDEAVRHVAFSWSCEAGESAELTIFAADGFTLEERVVLSAQFVRERVAPIGIAIRELCGARDWDALLDLEMRMREPIFEPTGYEAFKRRQLGAQRRLCRDGIGAWIGAFAGDGLVGSCGIFSAGTFARYQNVGVDEPWRNRGIAKALLCDAAHIGYDRLGADRCIIVADAASSARTLYERAGFALIQREWALWRAPQS